MTTQAAVPVGAEMTTAATSNLAEAVCEQPLLVDAEYAHGFLAAVAAMPVNLDVGIANDGFWDGWLAKHLRPYNVQEGILTIPVQGALLDKVTVAYGAWMTGYEYLQRAFERGMEDSAVRGIVLDIDSPGGQAEGNFELVAHMRQRLGGKPVTAVANGKALSGAYSIASVADRIIVRPSGVVGSVGVLSVHFDRSQAFAQRGVAISIIRSGAHKAEGNPYEPLSEHARADMQARSDLFYGMFVDAVTAGRPMSGDDVRGTEGRVYTAEEGVIIGLADSIGEFRQEMVRMATTQTGGQMKKAEELAAELEAAKAEAAEAKEAAEAAKAEAAEAKEALSAQADNADGSIDDKVTQAIAADRKRTGDVRASDEYAGREALADHLLTGTEMTAEQIMATLKASPKAGGGGEDGGHRDHFREYMDRHDNPPAGGGEPPEASADIVADHPDWPGRPKASVAILEAYQRAGGKVSTDRRKTG